VKSSLLEFAKELGVKGWRSVVFLITALGFSIWLAVVGSIDLIRGLNSYRSVGLGILLVGASAVMVGYALMDRIRFQSNRGRRLTLLSGVLVFALGVLIGIRLNSWAVGIGLLNWFVVWSEIKFRK